MDKILLRFILYVDSPDKDILVVGTNEFTPQVALIAAMKVQEMMRLELLHN